MSEEHGTCSITLWSLSLGQDTVFKYRLNIHYRHYKYETILSVTSLMSYL